MDEEKLAPDGGQEELDAPVVEEPQAEPQPISVDDLATEMGWTPQDKWRGDPEKWKPADEFVRRTVDVNRNLTGRLRGLEDQVTTMARTSAVLTERAVTEAREKILAERQEAFEMGDGEAFNRADKKLQELPTVPQVNIEPPEVRSFRERNAWFGTDDQASAWAFNRAGELGKAGITDPARQLAIVEREAKQLFPEHFPEEGPKPKPAPLNKPGNRGSAPQAKTLSALPPGAQAMIKEYVSKGICTVEEGVKAYFEEQGA